MSRCINCLIKSYTKVTIMITPLKNSILSSKLDLVK